MAVDGDISPVMIYQVGLRYPEELRAQTGRPRWLSYIAASAHLVGLVWCNFGENLASVSMQRRHQQLYKFNGIAD